MSLKIKTFSYKCYLREERKKLFYSNHWKVRVNLPSRDETAEIIMMKNEVTEAVFRRCSVNDLFRNLA